jgi:hypothetical protein
MTAVLTIPIHKSLAKWTKLSKDRTSLVIRVTIFSYGDVAQSRRTQPQSFSVDEGTESCPDTDAQSCHGQVIVVRIDTLDKVDSEQESCIEVGVLFG